MTRRGEGYGELLRIWGEHVEDREVLVFVLASLALVWLLVAEKRGLRFRDGWLVRGALLALVLGLAATVVEGFFTGPPAEILNGLEHTLYLCHTALLLVLVLRGGPRLWGGT